MLDITNLAVAVVLGALGFVLGKLVDLRSRSGGAGMHLPVFNKTVNYEEIFGWLDTMAVRVIRGLNEADVLDDAIADGEAKMARAMEIVEFWLNQYGFKIDLDEDVVAREAVRWWLEGVYSSMRLYQKSNE